MHVFGEEEEGARLGVGHVVVEFARRQRTVEVSLRETKGQRTTKDRGDVRT